MRSILSNIVWTCTNLLAGLRLTLPLRVSRQSFQVTSNQALILLFFALGATFLSTYLVEGSGARLTPLVWTMTILAARCFLVLLLYYLVAQLAGALDKLPAMAVALFAAAPFLYLYQLLTFWIVRWLEWRWPPLTGMAGYLVSFGIIVIWGAVAIVRAVRLVFDAKWLRASLLSGAIILGSIAVNNLVPPFFWHVPRAAAADDDDSPLFVDTEKTYYAQPALVSRALAALSPARRGVGELYFVGFAGTSTQDVFMKEVRSAEALFDTRFGTRHRSLILVNNPQTVGELPLASVSNLRLVLSGVGKRMNVEDDILFLYLTSHGSRHVFSVQFPGLDLNNLSDRQLKAILDSSGIKWRVLVISACYSGSFIDTLKDDHTLVMTAASKDRTSFGCSNENDFTYFGDAYINTALRQDRSFISAFYRARDIIAAREQAERLKASEPQIYVGREMRAKLDRLERRLARRTDVAAATGPREGSE